MKRYGFQLRSDDENNVASFLSGQPGRHIASTERFEHELAPAVRGRTRRPLAWRGGRPPSRRQWLADVQLPTDSGRSAGAGDHLGPYRLLPALGSAALRGQSNLLPPNHTPDMLARLRELFPDACVLVEEDAADSELPTYRFTSAAAQSHGIESVPTLRADAVVAHMLTSGSTGTPTRHDKHWGLLVENIGAEAKGWRSSWAAARWKGQHRGHRAGASHVRLRVHLADLDDRWAAFAAERPSFRATSRTCCRNCRSLSAGDHLSFEEPLDSLALPPVDLVSARPYRWPRVPSRRVRR
jgi:hypothetical protein